MSTVKISEYTGNISGSNINIGATGSFGRLICTTISASTGEFDANTIFIGGTSFNKTNLDDLKAGKSLNTSQIEIGGLSFTKAEIERLKEGKTITTNANRLTKRVNTPSRASRPTKGTAVTQVMDDVQKVDALVNNADDSTFIQANVTGSFDFVINNTSSIAITTSSVDISVPVSLPSITGSTHITGSVSALGAATFDCGNDGFNVNNLLDLLANFGNTGVPTGSDGFGNDLPGGGVGAGDINLDGQVNISDLLLLLSGLGNPATLCSNITIPPNVNSQLVGPIITISSSVVLTVSDTATLRVF